MQPEYKDYYQDTQPFSFLAWNTWCFSSSRFTIVMTLENPFQKFSFKFQAGEKQAQALLLDTAPSVPRKYLGFSGFTQTLLWIKHDAAPSHTKHPSSFLPVKGPANRCQAVLQCHLVSQTHFNSFPADHGHINHSDNAFQFFTKALLFLSYDNTTTRSRFCS